MLGSPLRTASQQLQASGGGKHSPEEVIRALASMEVDCAAR